MHLKNFLEENFKKNNGFFSLVNYNNHTIAVWFHKSIEENSTKILASSCEAIKLIKIHGSEDLFCKEFISKNLIISNELNKDEFIKNNVKAFIKDGWFYNININNDNLEIPEEVDSVKAITKKECFDFLKSTK